MSNEMFRLVPAFVVLHDANQVVCDSTLMVETREEAEELARCAVLLGCGTIVKSVPAVEIDGRIHRLGQAVDEHEMARVMKALRKLPEGDRQALIDWYTNKDR
jgi:hypothetical protein